MTFLALLIVLVAAFMHAFWNLLLKRANSGLAFMWLVFVAMVVCYLPLSILILTTQHPVIETKELVAIAGNGILQMLYFYLLNQSYRFGDLSLVYPLARGSGPLIVLVAAVTFIGEHPTAIALAGAMLIGFGVLLLSANFKELRASGAYKGVMFALLTGACIAGYTLWDRYAVRDLRLPPMLYLWGGAIVQMTIVTPFAMRHRDQVQAGWRGHWKAAIAIGVISLLAYGLILFALTFSPVSYIAPAREISVLIGAMMGSRVLDEDLSARRIVAAVAMVAGMIGLALG